MLLQAQAGGQWDSDKKIVGEGAGAGSCGALLRNSDSFSVGKGSDWMVSA